MAVISRDTLRYFAKLDFAKEVRMSGRTEPGQLGGRASGALSHPLRVALLGLLGRRGTLTSMEAARELGESSGACSFHLRQLERYGQVEEVPGRRGRARPWRLATAGPAQAGGDGLGDLARELEDEGYRRWLAGRDSAPPGWDDEAFSAILRLTPAQLAEVARAVRGVIASFGDAGPEHARPESAMPVGVVVRMFPLLPASSDG
jgi:helix-turn-helix protein